MEEMRKPPVEGKPPIDGKPPKKELWEHNRFKQFYYLMLFWSLAVISAFVGAEIQFSEIRDTGMDYATPFLSGTLYSFEPLPYVLGAVVYMGLFVFFWWLILRGRLRIIRRSGFMTFLYGLGCFMGVLGIFAIVLLSDMRYVGIFSGLEQKWLEAVTIFGWPLFALILSVIAVVRDVKAEKFDL